MDISLPDWVSLFSFPFMQRAILGGVLLGILGGIFSRWTSFPQGDLEENASRSLC